MEMEPGTYEFKFINGNDWSNGYENMEGTSCNNGGNELRRLMRTIRCMLYVSMVVQAICVCQTPILRRSHFE